MNILNKIDEGIELFITYKWLSRTLNVHINRAKQMLYSYVQKHKAENITVTYLISGFQKCEENSILKVAIIKDNDLETWKSQLNPITSLHIYSIQKSKLKNSNALYIADFDKQKETNGHINKYSAISCPDAVLRSENEINQKDESLHLHSLVTNVKKPSPVKNRITSNAKSGIKNLFAAQENKNKDVNKKEEKIISKKKEEKIVSRKNTFEDSCYTSKNKHSHITQEKNKEYPFKKEKNNSTKSKHQETNKDRHRIIDRSVFSSESEEEDPLPKKKRKRIQSYSSSSEEEAVLESENHSSVISDQSEENIIQSEVKQKIPNENNGHSSRHRQKKLVAKKFLDEDGFMVTKKVWESASESEPENRVPSPRPALKNNIHETKSHKSSKSNKKKTSPTRAKQAALTAFFKKI